MKNMDNYRWIIPSLIALGVILLSGGIFVGVKSYETLEANSTKVDNTTQKNLSSKQKFKLDEYCQIWLQDDNEIPVMLGKVNEDLLNKTEDEIKTALKEKYPDKQIHILNDVKEAFPLMRKLSDKETYVLLENDLPDIFNE